MQPPALLLGLGYPVAAAVVTRFVPVVREGRWRWLAAHHAGMAAIVAGWALRGEPVPAALNASWLATSSVWYLVGRRRPAAT
ncbi:MAG TPA: hypothetical protein VNT56_04305 [Acidimicrobiales bacterium]|nr:hypothetical protein [Acidimicrobiales bacterium]